MPSLRDHIKFRQDTLFSTRLPGQGWKVLLFVVEGSKLVRPQERIVLLRTSFLMPNPFGEANSDFQPSMDAETAQIVFRTSDPLGFPPIGGIVYVDDRWAYRLDAGKESDNTQRVYEASRLSNAELARFGPKPPELPLR